MVAVGFRMRSLLLVVSSGGRGLIVDDFQKIIADQYLKRFVVEVGVGDLTALVGAEVQYLAPGKGHAKRNMGFVANRLHGESS